MSTLADGTAGASHIITNLSDFRGINSRIAGITLEWIDRLYRRRGSRLPKKEHWGSDDKKLVAFIRTAPFFNIREPRGNLLRAHRCRDIKMHSAGDDGGGQG
jgi:hypothetical protein